MSCDTSNDNSYRLGLSDVSMCVPVVLIWSVLGQFCPIADKLKRRTASHKYSSSGGPQVLIGSVQNIGFSVSVYDKMNLNSWPKCERCRLLSLVLSIVHGLSVPNKRCIAIRLPTRRSEGSVRMSTRPMVNRQHWMRLHALTLTWWTMLTLLKAISDEKHSVALV